MKWYLIKLVYQIICGDGRHAPQFEEQLRLVNATDATQAIEKAKEIGCREAETFFNNNMQLVQWKFIDVCSLLHITEFADGAEVCSTIQEYSDESAYLKMSKEKAVYLVNNVEAHSFPIA